jgi:cephalosporin-C deacetylase-like acetyl esterase
MKLTHSFHTLALLSLLPAAALWGAQENPKVKPGAEDTSPRKTLYSYLQTEARKDFDARRREVAAIKTPDDLKRRQEHLRAKFIEALGGFPARTPLNPRIVGALRGDGFRLEKVIYESRPHHHVTALLYVPDGNGPFPGVLLPCGHSVNGKAAKEYQRACILLAKNGLAALCYDPIGQGERSQILNGQGKPALSNTSEHTMVGIGALLVGRNTATYRIWDGIRSLDYLAGRPEIDPKRLGCTGNSGGGTLTAYLMALDDRIVAAAPSCYLTSLERLFATIGPQDAEQNITGQVAFEMEHADYVTMRAPRPTLMCVATQDFFDIQGAHTTFREAKSIYERIGHGERVAFFEHNDKHGFSKPRREAAMRWMRRWLLDRDDAPSEGDFPIVKDADLQCTRSGQVLEDFHGKSVVHLNIEAVEELAKQRAKVRASSNNEELLREVRRLITLGKRPEVISPDKASPDKVGDLEVVIQRFPLEPGITVGGPLLFAGDRSRPRPLVLYVSGDSYPSDRDQDKAMSTLLRREGPVFKLASAGNHVLALDVRGMGRTAPGVAGAKQPNHFGVDIKEAFLALHLNRPLLGQRVHDVLAVTEYYEKLAWVSEIRLVGVGSAGPIALHAAALDRRIKSVRLEKSLVSWSAVVKTPISINQLTNVVPGALKVYDLPDLAAAVAPRHLTIADAVDAAGNAVAEAELEQAYAGCRAAYRRAGAERNLRLATNGDWER